MAKQEWTVAAVRMKLPDVRCHIGCTTVTGRVSGRKQDAALVTVMCPCPCRKPGCEIEVERFVAWKTVAACLNNDRVINLN